MFAVMVTGRLAQTQYDQISETQVLFTIPDADSINHIVVFMTGATPFPDGLGAQVYFSWPEPNAPPTWLLLGYISNCKPSAIFKISSLKNMQQLPEGFVNQQFGQQQFSHVAQIGLSVEPLFNIQQMTPSIAAQPSKASKYAEFAQKLLDNFCNYMSSFGITQSEMIPNPSETFIPMSKMQTWFTNIQRRLLQNPDFLTN